jgi:hypothetical protein
MIQKAADRKKERTRQSGEQQDLSKFSKMFLLIMAG